MHMLTLQQIGKEPLQHGARVHMGTVSTWLHERTGAVAVPQHGITCTASREWHDAQEGSVWPPSEQAPSAGWSCEEQHVSCRRDTRLQLPPPGIAVRKATVSPVELQQ